MSTRTTSCVKSAILWYIGHFRCSDVTRHATLNYSVDSDGPPHSLSDECLHLWITNTLFSLSESAELWMSPFRENGMTSKMSIDEVVRGSAPSMFGSGWVDEPSIWQQSPQPQPHRGAWLGDFHGRPRVFDHYIEKVHQHNDSEASSFFFCSFPFFVDTKK